mmetsp:Transcript_32071/g.78703  ORF Transcript_32071/g.78703 Transcript_32071/m.78703 type:complete len:193 (-) Transcript_32071:321-899(-)|eukprot:CAMPEP_0206279674 /NCGR_PEP_ID=MMETSP0047_2-20121206/38144_1 /ASSEMBLY_ACC=CAM_ASM_000192 /TAXON_ID=195065 /ORGANISM="Chroomonas mesostigmatica_cf, Strain CCMP1168" /LENGTH=192 /DNA_ID=CAMNT_0053709631 /DNA_START=222 /DNA_END=800 /DNA_ORIENTATION=+
MGAGASRNTLTDKQIQKLVKETGFAPSELEFLYRRFRSLCKRGDSLSKQDIADNEHLAANPYVKRLYGVIAKNEFGEVTFEAFVSTAATFRPGKDLNTKLQFIFNLFDYNMDDTLEPDELSDMIKTVRPDIPEDENRELVSKTIADIIAKGGDVAGDGEVHGKSFIAYAKLLPGIDKLLTLNLADELNLKVD